ncbi:hypothetical protein [Ruegeria sp. HKCCD7221]|uniref:hypothetical protein n=1 Tax=Ruegeria sp. HKCCD7221 TaxID=2683009 RepID=UPI00148966B3|nr:hypothetical protein [Ruegeria sp. HKCCD7221]
MWQDIPMECGETICATASTHAAPHAPNAADTAPKTITQLLIQKSNVRIAILISRQNEPPHASAHPNAEPPLTTPKEKPTLHAQSSNNEKFRKKYCETRI